jgi:hypothetical protein
MSATEAGLGVHNLLDIIVFGSWYLFFIGLTFRLSQTYYYDVLRSRAKRVVRRKKKPIIRWRLGPGKDIRHVLIQKNILSLWRTRRFFMPLLYSFIFLFLPLYQIIPTYTGSEPMGTFQSAIFIAILFMLMGVSGMVQGQIRKERGQMWIERSAGLKPEHVVDSIATAATMVGAIYVCVVSLILSFFFGAKVLIYLPLIIASGLIPANFAVYSGIASPPEGGMGFSSQMFLSLLSLLLSMPYFIPVLLSTFINDARSIFILSISILVYTVIVVLILRRKAGRKFATYEIPY